MTGNLAARAIATANPLLTLAKLWSNTWTVNVKVPAADGVPLRPAVRVDIDSGRRRPRTDPPRYGGKPPVTAIGCEVV